MIDSLPDEARHALIADLTISKTRAGQVLWDATAPFGFVLFPLDSAESVVMSADDGAAIGVRTVGSEGMLGLKQMKGASTPHGHCVCEIGGSIACLDVSRLDALKARYPAIGSMIEAYRMAMLFGLMKAVVCGHFHSLAQRCAKHILELHDRSAGQPFTLTQERLAEILGAGRASVALRTGAFQAEKLIAYRSGKMTVLDHTGLAEHACSCYSELKAAFDRALLY